MGGKQSQWFVESSGWGGSAAAAQSSVPSLVCGDLGRHQGLERYCRSWNSLLSGVCALCLLTCSVTDTRVVRLWLYILLELEGWCCFSSSSLVWILMPGILQQIWGGWCGFCLQAEGNYWVKRSREVAVQIQWYSLRAGGWRDLRKTFQTLFIWRFCHL